jgi:hypothetical protein
MSRTNSEGRACHARLEGHVYRARRSAMGFQTIFCGPDKRVPPKDESEGHARRARLEGRACHARGSGMDDPT